MGLEVVMVSILVSCGASQPGGRLGEEIHPNRHRHHQHDIHLAGFFPTGPGQAASPHLLQTSLYADLVTRKD